MDHLFKILIFFCECVGGVTTSASYDAQDRMTQYGVYDYSYNANGELTSKTNTLTSAVTNYIYDVFGNLLSVTLPSADVISYEVDGLHRRVGRKLNGVLTRRYVYAGALQIVGEIDAVAGNLVRRYVYSSKQNIPDYFIEGTEEFRIISDYLGSPRVIVKVSDGTVMQKMDHDEFGRVRLDTNPGYTPFGFAGGTYDAQAGLVRFGARDYDPETGRWTSKDPILFGGGDTNLYGYVLNDPVNFIDPSGNFAIALVPFIPAMVEGALFVGSAVGASIGISSLIDAYVKPPSNAYDPAGPKAPGRPSEEDGFVCPKGGDNWVPNPNGPGFGWEAKDGRVWVPTGPGGRAHGGPHWDVQTPGGGYQNVRPRR